LVLEYISTFMDIHYIVERPCSRVNILVVDRKERSGVKNVGWSSDRISIACRTRPLIGNDIYLLKDVESFLPKISTV
jgi:hypothetical protein